MVKTDGVVAWKDKGTFFPLMEWLFKISCCFLCVSHKKCGKSADNLTLTDTKNILFFETKNFYERETDG